MAFLVTSPATVAHNLTGNICVEPVRPTNDQDDVAWQSFLNDIDTFRACVTAQMQQHEAAVTQHQALARQSVDRWNEFVRTSLNAPADFPWPPEERKQSEDLTKR